MVPCSFGSATDIDENVCTHVHILIYFIACDSNSQLVYFYAGFCIGFFQWFCIEGK